MFADDDYVPEAGDVIEMGGGTTWTLVKVYRTAVDFQIHHNGIRSTRQAPALHIFRRAVAGKLVRRPASARRSA